MEKYPLLDYETFKNSEEKGDKWVSDFFTYIFSKETKIPKRRNMDIPKNINLQQIQKLQDNLKFRYPNLESTFYHFIKAYASEYKEQYNSMLFEKSSNLKTNGINALINVLLNPSVEISNILANNLAEGASWPLQLQKLYKEYANSENVFLNEYVHRYNVLVQWRVLTADNNQKFSNLQLTYNNFKVIKGEQTPSIVRNVFTYGSSKDPELLPVPWKVKLSKLNYILILDRDGNFIKLNDFIDNPEFQTVRPLFKFNLWSLGFDKRTLLSREAIQKQYVEKTKDAGKKTASYETLKRQKEENDKNSSFTGGYITDFITGKKSYKNKEEWIKLANENLKNQKKELDALSLEIEELKSALEEGADGRALPPRKEDVKLIDFNESAKETDTYDFLLHTKVGTTWYGRVKVDILNNKIELLRGGYITLEKQTSPNLYARYTDAKDIKIISYVESKDADEMLRAVFMPKELNIEEVYDLNIDDLLLTTSEFRLLVGLGQGVKQYSFGRTTLPENITWDTTSESDRKAQEAWLKKWEGNYTLEAQEVRPKLGYAISTANEEKKHRTLRAGFTGKKDFTFEDGWRKFFSNLAVCDFNRFENQQKIEIKIGLDILNPKLTNNTFVLNKEKNITLNSSTKATNAWNVHILNFTLSYTPKEFYNQVVKPLTKEMTNIGYDLLLEENIESIDNLLKNSIFLKDNVKLETSYKIRRNAQKNNHVLDFYLGNVVLVSLELPRSLIADESGQTRSYETLFRVNSFEMRLPEYQVQINKYRLIGRSPFTILIEEDKDKAFQLNFKAEQFYQEPFQYYSTQPLVINNELIYTYKTANNASYVVPFNLSQDNTLEPDNIKPKKLEQSRDRIALFFDENIAQVYKITQLGTDALVLLSMYKDLIDEEENYFLHYYIKNADRTQDKKYLQVTGSFIPNNSQFEAVKMPAMSVVFWEGNVFQFVDGNGNVWSTLFNKKPYTIIQNPFIYKLESGIKNYRYLGDAVEIARFESSNMLISLPIDDVKQIDNKVIAYSYMNENVLNYISNNNIDSTWHLIGNDGFSKLAKFNNKIIKTANENITFTATLEINFMYYDEASDSHKSDNELSVLVASVFSNADNLKKLKSYNLMCDIYQKKPDGSLELEKANHIYDLTRYEKTIKNNIVWIQVPFIIHTTKSASLDFVIKNFRIGGDNPDSYRKLTQWEDELEIASNTEIIIKDIIYSLNA
ncbi:hypothetical protein ACM0LK_01175 [Mycoplasma sp. Z331B]|uniref:hypothetical protein n=1 Tax=Mycoplasma sp. Z331B TaxID=3398775 RepID=UPI003A89A3C2